MHSSSARFLYSLLHMENRAELQNEYHGLIIKLNSTNRKVDQKTEIAFSIIQLTQKQRNLIATVNFEKYLSFGQIQHNAHLLIDEQFMYPAFAEYIKISIKDAKTDEEIILAVRFAINRLFSVQLSKKPINIFLNFINVLAHFCD